MRLRDLPHLPALALGLSATLLAVGPAPAATSASAGPATCAEHRVVAWTAAPTDAVASLPPLEQTYRIRVVPRIGGEGVQVRLSNRFGIGPVTFGRVRVGVQRSGPAVVPGSQRPVTFSGADRVRVPRGEDVLSDVVPMPVTGDRALLVSVYVVGAPGPATQHVLAEQTTWQSPPLTGDRTADLTGAGFLGLPVPGLTPALPQGIPYLAGLDVTTSSPAGAVVAFGDSITDGFQGSAVPLLPAAEPVDRDARYPDRLAARVAGAGIPLAVVNAGISGNQLLRYGQLPIFGPPGLSRLDRDALDLPGVSLVILLEGINDIGQSSARPEALIAGYTRAIERAHDRGIDVLLGTLTPDEGTLQPGYGVMGEKARVAVNAWIRSQTLSDGVVDFDAAVRDPAHPSRILPAYDGGDHLHFSPAGYQAMADAVSLDDLDALGDATCG